MAVSSRSVGRSSAVTLWRAPERGTLRGDLQRQLGRLVLDCTACGQTVHYTSASASPPETGRTGSPRRTASRSRWIPVNSLEDSDPVVVYTSPPRHTLNVGMESVGAHRTSWRYRGTDRTKCALDNENQRWATNPIAGSHLDSVPAEGTFSIRRFRTTYTSRVRPQPCRK
jgi:hypothetical protein